MARSIPEDNVTQGDTPGEDIVPQYENPTYKMYPIRWLVLLTIFFFNLSNNLLWISFSAVSTTGTHPLLQSSIFFTIKKTKNETKGTL